MKQEIKNLSDMYEVDPILACHTAIKETQGISERVRLEEINKLLGGYGTEAIRCEVWQNGYWGDICACYVNMGDTYNTTVVQVRGSFGTCSRFTVTTWGDFVEKNQDKYNII